MAYTTLKKGSSGNGVKKLQQALIDAGYDVGSTGADGIFGTNTEKAVKSYQKDNGLSVDGIAGNQTFGSLYATSEGTTSGVQTNTGANYTVNPTSKNLNGVDQETTDRMNSSFLPSDKIGEIGEQRDEAWDIYKGYATDTEIIDPEIWEILNTPFVESDEYKQAMGYADNILEQLSTGRTQYTDQIIDMMDKIQNREDFEYDVDKDQLFQQALASAIGSGKSAMQDTIGQASSLTGGYGSTYATSAGNQAYNAFIEDAYNNLPEYYQMALDAYKMEGEEMYQQLGMLRDADATEYQRMYNSWDAYFKTGQQIWYQDHTKWQDKTTNAYNQANLQLEEHSQLTQNAYDMYTALNNQYEAQYAREYADWENLVTQAQTYAQLLNSDWWNQKNYDQAERHHDDEMKYKYAALDASKSSNTPMYSYEEMAVAASSAGTQSFNASIMTGSEFSRRGNSANNKRYDSYNQYVYNTLDDWYKDGKLTKSEVAYLKGAYGLTDDDAT